MVIYARTNLRDNIKKKNYKFLIKEDIDLRCINVLSSEPLIIKKLQINDFKPKLTILSIPINFLNINLVIEYFGEFFTLYILYQDLIPKCKPSSISESDYIINICLNYDDDLNIDITPSTSYIFRDEESINFNKQDNNNITSLSSKLLQKEKCKQDEDIGITPSTPYLSSFRG